MLFPLVFLVAVKTSWLLDMRAAFVLRDFERAVEDVFKDTFEIRAYLDYVGFMSRARRVVREVFVRVKRHVQYHYAKERKRLLELGGYGLSWLPCWSESSTIYPQAKLDGNVQ